MDQPQLLRIPLYTKRGAQKPNREKTFQAFYERLNVGLTKLIDVNNGYIALCQRQSDMDSVLSEEARHVLENINLEAKVPSQIITQRSIICRKLDIWVGSHSPEDIKAEVERNHTWAKVKEVIKFGNHTHIVKIVFRTTEMAHKAKEGGILLFNVAISHEQIEKEIFVNVQMCFTCYRMEQHLTKECPNKDLMVCSECSGTDHRYNACVSHDKKCLNCNGPHRTMSMACPIKKDIIKNKKDMMTHAKENKEKETYAKIAKEAITQERSAKSIIRISKDVSTEVLVCILHAHVMNNGCPGTYRTSLNEMLKKNNLKEMWFPDNPPSSQVLNMEVVEEELLGAVALPETETGTKPKTKNITQRERNEQRTSKKQNSPKQKKQTEKNEPNYKLKWDKRMERYGELETESETETILTETESVSSDLNVRSLVTEIEDRKAALHRKSLDTQREKEETVNYTQSDLKLKIFHTARNPLPKGNYKDLIQGFRENKYKYEYDSTLPEKDIEYLLSNTKIRITPDMCHLIPQDIFQKKRNGRVRSPTMKISNKEPDRRRSK